MKIKSRNQQIQKALMFIGVLCFQTLAHAAADAVSPPGDSFLGHASINTPPAKVKVSPTFVPALQEFDKLLAKVDEGGAKSLAAFKQATGKYFFSEREQKKLETTINEAIGGDAFSQNSLGYQYYSGVLLKDDSSGELAYLYAAKWFVKAALQRNVDALTHLAQMVDQEDALLCLKKAMPKQTILENKDLSATIRGYAESLEERE